jgi:hypothetical protein
MFHVPKLILTGKTLVEFSRKPMRLDALNIVYLNITLIKSILKKYRNK